MSSMLERALERVRTKPRVEAKLVTKAPADHVRLIDKLRLVSAVIKLIKHRNEISMKSWKTTFFGGGGLFLIWAPVVAAALDGNPATIPAYGAAVAASLPAIGLMFAKDHNVTGAK